MDKHVNRLNNLNKKIIDLLKELNQKQYFRADNFNKNITTMKKEIVTDDLLPLGQLAMYIGNINTIIIQEKYMDYLTDEQITMLIFHELIHMSSTNLQTLQTGYDHSKLPVMFNEGCTQWLTLKIMYGDSINEKLEKNILYHDSTIIINDLVNKIGEDKVFEFYFSNSPKELLKSLSQSDFDITIESINLLKNSEEEKKTKDSLNIIKEKVQNYKKDTDIDREKLQ